MTHTSHLLSDQLMSQFIAHGYVTINNEVESHVHDEIFSLHESVFEKEGNPGNNLLPRMPIVETIFSDPPVVGALKSILGTDYYLQPHRHPHHNPAKSQGQNMHQDGGKRWSHRTRYLLAFYYPQNTPLERGPSGIVPGSHYFNTPEGARIDKEIPLATNAGTVTICDYDLWHRAMPNTTENHRFMIKFLFARMSEPVIASWNNHSEEWPGVDSVLTEDGQQWANMYAHRWHWHRGQQSLPSSTTNMSLNNLIPLLSCDEERTAIAAAYDIASYGEDALPHLIELLNCESEMTRRHSAYALSALGSLAVSALEESLKSTLASTRSDAATILGDIGLSAHGATQSLIKACDDTDPEVRRRAVEALGTISGTTSLAVPTLIDRLNDDHETVRVASVMALCRIGQNAAEAVPALIDVLEDDNRYVRADALHALRRIRTKQSREVLIEQLLSSRWCPLTTSDSTF